MINFLYNLNYLNIFFFLIISFLFLFISNNKNFFIDNTMSSSHKKFFSYKNDIKIPNIGGLIIFFSLILITNDQLLILFSFFILVLGLISDFNKVTSPNIRLFFQFIIILFFIIIFDLLVYDLRNNFLNYFLENKLFSYCFSIFCFWVLINGSNMIDGLNNLNLGYFLIITIQILLINSDIIIDNNFLINFFVVIVIIYSLNFLEKIYLGDSGSYLIAFIFGWLLFQLHIENKQISPYYIMLLLWYPAFENLFSIVRKRIQKKQSTKPDNLHLHHLVYVFFKNKFRWQSKWINTFSGNAINLYNLFIFFIGTKYFFYSKILIFLTIFNIVFYIIIYFALYRNVKYF